MTALQTFFEAMRPFLLGESTAEDVVAACGESPSGLERLRLYRRLVDDDYTAVLDKLYVMTRESVSARTWSALRADYLRDHTPTGWEMNRLGEQLPSWLAARGPDPAVPPWLPELADYEWLEFATFTSPEDDLPPWKGEGPPAINPTAGLRQLRYDIPRWVLEGREASPEGRTTTLLAWRDPRTMMCRFAEGTAETLFLLTAVTQGQAPEDAAREHGLDTTLIGALTRDLGSRGLLVLGG
jgi:hypothetical protein